MAEHSVESKWVRIQNQICLSAAQQLSDAFEGFWEEIVAESGDEHDRSDPHDPLMHDRGLMKVLAGDEAAWRTRLCQIYETSALGWNTSMHRTATAKRAWTLMSESQLDLEVRTMQAIETVERALQGLLSASDEPIGKLAEMVGHPFDIGNPWGADPLTRGFISSLPLRELSPRVLTLAMRHYQRRIVPALKKVLPSISARIDEESKVAPSDYREPDFLDMVSFNAPARIQHGFTDEEFWMRGASNQEATIGDIDETHRQRQSLAAPLAQWRERSSESSKTPDQAKALPLEDLLTLLDVVGVVDKHDLASALGSGDAEGVRRIAKQRIADAAGQFGYARGVAALGASESDALDLAAIYFTGLVKSREVYPPQLSLLAELFFPFLRYTVADDAFYGQPLHPWAQAFDLLIESTDSYTPRGSTGTLHYQQVERCVKALASTKALDGLHEAVGQLREQVEAQRARARLHEQRLVHTVDARERLGMARRSARLAMVDTLGNKAVTASTFHFLATYWENALAQVRLRHGPDSSEMNAMRALGPGLVDCEQDAMAYKSSELATRFSQLEPGVEACLQASGVAIEDAMREAKARLFFGIVSGEDKQAGRPLPPLVLPAEMDDALVNTNASATMVAMVRRLEPGRPMLLLEDGRETPVHVAWVSPTTARILLVDQAGGRKAFASPEALAAMIDRQELRIGSVSMPSKQAMESLRNELGNVA